ncbi:uncharacterized protein LOC134812285 isoform X2 [Bolinopsis microptera]|uniref:uncharacterized protein LOC134812285 isoform X2 n=1 Tax=Bolinopsis microptera TaxID=2820187 RepID=UPI003079BD10
MNRQMLTVLAVMAGAALVLGNENCTSTCTAYKACSSLNVSSNYTAFLNNSLVCDSQNDGILGKLFGSMSSCGLKDAAIEVADLLDIGWDGVSSLEAIISDEEFWLEGCQWDQLAAAACIYYSVPAKGECTNSPSVSRNGLFCAGECMNLAKGCLNLEKYRHLTESITDFCKSVTNADAKSTTCLKGQVDQAGLTAPKCPDGTVKETSLTGPFILAGIAFALAMVALIGLALITCKGDGSMQA